jgi:hypothetical protein
MDPMVIYVGAGFVIGWLAWGAAFNRPTRPCPRCGRDVLKGELDCPHCGFDFRTIGASG